MTMVKILCCCFRGQTNASYINKLVFLFWGMKHAHVHETPSPTLATIEVGLHYSLSIGVLPCLQGVQTPRAKEDVFNVIYTILLCQRSLVYLVKLSTTAPLVGGETDCTDKSPLNRQWTPRCATVLTRTRDCPLRSVLTRARNPCC